MSLGLKQSAFADHIGTTQATVSRWERGVQVPEERFRKRIRLELTKHDFPADDALVLSMIRYSPCMMSVIDRSFRFVSYSSGLKFALGEKIHRLHRDRLTDVMTPIVRGVLPEYIQKLFSNNCELISVSMNDRSALMGDFFVRRSWSAIRISGERHVVCQDQLIPSEKARLLELEVVTFDDTRRKEL